MSLEPSRWAILIGIDFYPSNAACLPGCVFDANLLESHIKEAYAPLIVYKFTASNNVEDEHQSIPLEDPSRWPTRANITSTLQSIAFKSKPGDYVLFFFAGHGTLKTTTSNYRNNYGNDAALVLLEPHNHGVRKKYMLGIELAEAFDILVDKGVLLTVVLDSCHSGGISRNDKNVEDRIRGLPWEEQVAQSSPAVNIISGAPISGGFREAKAAEHWLFEPHGYALIAACGPDDTAKVDLCPMHGFKHGVFTCAFCGALKTASDLKYRASLQLIYAEICSRLRGRERPQYPLFLGNLDHPFLKANDDNEIPKAGYNVIKIDGENIWLNAGQMHGVSVSDRYRVCSPGNLQAQSPENMNEQGIIIIMEVYGLTSKARLYQTSTRSASQDISTLELGWNASLMYRGGIKAKIKVNFKLDSSFTEQIGKSRWLQFSEEPDETNDGFLQVARDADNRVTIRHKDVLLTKIPWLPNAIEVSQGKILAVLEHLAQFLSFEGLSNQSTNALTDEHFTVKIIHKKKDVESNYVQINDQETIDIFIQNKTSAWLYYWIYDLELPTGKIWKTYPAEAHACAYLAPNTTPIGPKDGRIFGTWARITPFTMTVSEELKEQGRTQVKDKFKIFVANEQSKFPRDILPSICDILDGDRSSQTSMSKFFQVLDATDSRSTYGQSSREERNLFPGTWGTKSLEIETNCPEETPGFPE